jgi:hypothetical protein
MYCIYVNFKPRERRSNEACLLGRKAEVHGRMIEGSDFALDGIMSAFPSTAFIFLLFPPDMRNFPLTDAHTSQTRARPWPQLARVKSMMIRS